MMRVKQEVWIYIMFLNKATIFVTCLLLRSSMFAGCSYMGLPSRLCTAAARCWEASCDDIKHLKSAIWAMSSDLSDAVELLVNAQLIPPDITSPKVVDDNQQLEHDTIIHHSHTMRGFDTYYKISQLLILGRDELLNSYSITNDVTEKRHAALQGEASKRLQQLQEDASCQLKVCNNI